MEACACGHTHPAWLVVNGLAVGFLPCPTCGCAEYVPESWATWAAHERLLAAEMRGRRTPAPPITGPVPSVDLKDNLEDLCRCGHRLGVHRIRSPLTCTKCECDGFTTAPAAPTATLVAIGGVPAGEALEGMAAAVERCELVTGNAPAYVSMATRDLARQAAQTLRPLANGGLPPGATLAPAAPREIGCDDTARNLKVAGHNVTPALVTRVVLKEILGVETRPLAQTGGRATCTECGHAGMLHPVPPIPGTADMRAGRACCYASCNCRQFKPAGGG